MSKKHPPPRNANGYPQTSAPIGAEENMKTDDNDTSPGAMGHTEITLATDKALAINAEKEKAAEAAKDAANKRQAKVRKAILSDLRLVPAKTLREWVADRITPEQAREMALGSDETSSAD